MKSGVLLSLFVIASLAFFFAAPKSDVNTGLTQSPGKSYSELRPQAFRAAAAALSPRADSFGPARPDSSRTNKRTAEEKARAVPNNLPFRKQVPGAAPDADGALAARTAAPMPPASLSFEGLNSSDNAAAYGFRLIPPDPFGDVGPNHYVQAVNALVRVFNKSGAALTPPFKLSSLFAPLATACAARNDGDPIVLYDALADRWLLSQFCTQAPPFRQMIAVSRTGDPTGDYYVYEFVMPNVKLNDYPKIGVWTDGYYMTTDQFLGSDYAGTGVFAFDKAKMLAGDPGAPYIYFDLASPSTIRLGGLLPADFDGLLAPPAGAPNTFAGYAATEYGDPFDAVRLYDFRADFENPENSTFRERPESPLAVAAFDPTSPDGRADIAQPAPGERLDSQSDRLMYRVAYRNFGAFDALVFNQTVRSSPIGDVYRAGVRVYELRRAAGANFAVREAATYGDGTTSRWMGAAAQDHEGNLALGYSIGNEEKAPSINYAGKLAEEPAGVYRTEATLVEGTGVQTAFGFRWGDYTGLSVDPADDCSFWLTNEYYTLESQEESSFGWLTRIGRFRFSECENAPRAALTGAVTNLANGAPVPGATLTANAVYSRATDAAGGYGRFQLVPGTYTVTAAARGFRPQTVVVTLADGETRPQNFALEPTAVPVREAISLVAESCAVNNAVEPGETVTMSVRLRNDGARAAANLTATLRATGGVTNPSGAQNYGALAVGASAERSFTFTAAANLACGDPLTLAFALSDGAESLGTIEFVQPTGTRRVALQENFDAVGAPQLPAGWTTAASGGQQNWTTSTQRFQSPPNSAFSPAPNQVGVNELVSPAFRINSARAEIEFRNWYELETTFLRNRLYDGAVLEISLGDGPWQDIEAAGGAFLAGGYDGVIDSCCQNPLAGRRGWSGRSGLNPTPEFITSKVKLPPSAAGRNARLRWRVGTDIGTFRAGQFIDDLVVRDEYVCSCAGATRRAPFDFDGDGRTDLSIYRPTDAAGEADFFILASASGGFSGAAWGSPGDAAANADYDGDGRTDFAVFRPSTRTWFVLQSATGTVVAVNFGAAGDLLAPADYDGDGKADLAVWRPSDGRWHITPSAGGAPRVQPFGLTADLPVAADYDGDGLADIAVFRPSEGNWYVFRSGDRQTAVIRFGTAGDRPAAGDYDGDGRADQAVFRPSDANWYLLRSTAGFAAVNFGLADDLPLEADFDGDGRRDIAVFRPATGVWYYLKSSDGAFAARLFGRSGDVPVPTIYVR